MKPTLLLSFLFSTLSLLTNAQNAWYVAAGGTGDGTSWQNASGDLQAVINESSSANGDSIFVAAGTYAPIRRADNPTALSPLDRDNAFVLKPGIVLLGSFTNNGASRNVSNSPSILTGSMTTDSISYIRAYHVIVATGVDKNTVLDGFTIQDGQANGSGNIMVSGMPVNRGNGGGIYIDSAITKMENSIVQNNSAKFGGGIYIIKSSPMITNTKILANSCTSSGGGLYIINRSNPKIFDVIVSNNTAPSGNGGGVYIVDTSSPELVNVTINSNSANTSVNGYGGGLYCGNYSNPFLTNVQINGNQSRFGAGITNAGNCLPVITNTLISGNYALWHGGGIYNWFSSIILTNVTIAGNRCVNGFGGGILNENAATDSILIRNTVIYWNERASIYNKFGSTYTPNSSNVRMRNCMVRYYPQDLANGNIDGSVSTANPNFIESSFNLHLRAPLSNGNYNLLEYSILRDRGDTSLFSVGRSPDLSHIKIDLAGNKRRWGGLDIGAYEFYKTFSGNDSTVCLGSNAKFFAGYYSDTLNTIYQWQLDTGSGFENITQDLSKYVLDRSEIQILQPPAQWQGYKYRLAAITQQNTTYSSIFTLNFGSTWTGYEDNTWENPGNWSCDMLPNESVDVVISGKNVTVNTEVYCKSLTLINGATLTVNPGGHIFVQQ